MILILASTAHSAPQRFEYSEMAMGVRARIVIYAPDEHHAQGAARAAFDRIAFLEQVMSDYRPDSEINRLSAEPVRVSPELYYILRKSQDLSRRSDGAFDVTVGPLIKLWRTARKTGVLPTSNEIEAARKLVGWRKVIIDPRRHTVALHSKMQLDLGGIAKGYACDEAIRVLKEHGITNALVEMGGDIVVSGPPPGKSGWEVSLVGGDSSRRTPLSNVAISSSGDTEQFVVIGGKRYSHIVDPRTGLGLTDRIAVTVIAPTGVLSDGLSTALSVLGPEKGRALLGQYPRVKAVIR